MTRDFFKMLEKQCREKESLLCVGLDPRCPADKIVEENRKLIEATVPYAVCYKPNSAFYEAFGPEGMDALIQTLAIVPDEIPVILDAKRGDIGSTAEAYAEAVFRAVGADAVTLSPYVGKDSVEPFLKWEGKAVFLLCRTTNPGASLIQDIPVEGTPLYLKLAREMILWNDRIGLVVAGNDPQALKEVRDLCPGAWFLSPGVGAQGGSMAEAVAAGIRNDGLGLLINVSRGLTSAENPAREAARLVEEYRKAEKISKSAVPAADPLKNSVLKGLIKTECFRTGEFTLKSGKKSPFYIDLRRVSSDPQLLRKTARAYARLLKGLSCDRLAGIPVAALPLATAVSLETGIPLIYPRIVMKEHGTGNIIEGEWKPGERVVLLDDLITTGKSKIEAISILKDAGLVVEDLIVLLERGRQGRADMTAAGINLRSFARIEELLDICLESGLINAGEHEVMIRYAGEE